MLQTLEREPQESFHGHHGGPHGNIKKSVISRI